MLRSRSTISRSVSGSFAAHGLAGESQIHVARREAVELRVELGRSRSRQIERIQARYHVPADAVVADQLVDALLPDIASLFRNRRAIASCDGE